MKEKKNTYSKVQKKSQSPKSRTNLSLYHSSSPCKNKKRNKSKKEEKNENKQKRRYEKREKGEEMKKRKQITSLFSVSTSFIVFSLKPTLFMFYCCFYCYDMLWLE
jgi:hypothetical protein